jgi:hypothetical protein
MHRKDQTTLEKLFSHPIPMNLEWSEIKTYARKPWR